jgi:hypothetical protein
VTPSLVSSLEWAANSRLNRPQSIYVPHVMLRAVAVTVRAQSEATNTATLPTSSSEAARPSIVDRSMSSTIASRPATPSGIVSGDTPGLEGHDPHAVGSELARQLPAESLLRLEGDLEAAQAVAGSGSP